MLNFGGFFVFFGVSGTDHNREERMHRRFEQEYFANIITLTLEPLPPGVYHFAEMPELVNRRGWTVSQKAPNTATTDLSNDGLEEFRAWWASGVRRVTPQRVDAA